MKKQCKTAERNTGKQKEIVPVTHAGLKIILLPISQNENPIIHGTGTTVLKIILLKGFCLT